MFPILKTAAGINPWNVHHVNLDLSPILDVREKASLKDLPQHTFLQFSERKAANWPKKSTDTTDLEVLMALKWSLADLIDTSIGFNAKSRQKRIFRYTCMDDSVFMIFVNEIRLDLSSFTLLADAAVVPMYDKTTMALYEANSLSQPLSTSCCSLRPEDLIAWKQLLPAVVERCRTWSHGVNCEYADKGEIPSYTGSPICSCGQGIGLPDRIPDVPQVVWDTVRPYATCAAISPLFAVAYLEPIIAAGLFDQLQDADAMGRCKACGGPGKPKLLVCGKCKKVKYCSPACNRSDWKTHKLVCRPST
ncbi:hypothetical protein C8Q72DRAFT_772009 [Fomitopsis betulina]|nr:hypothetical protein C8Q72DRAFT_772009 [Fomitopsis betulina]